MSALTDYYTNKVKELEDNPVSSYDSKYQSSLDSVLNKIQNREDFSYDFNADPLYQNYKDQYTKLGKEAAMNAAADVSALTGGYGNSYAATAASQANQQYLTQLNNVIPELYDAALSKYQMDNDQLTEQYAALGEAEDRSYNQYRDSVEDANTTRDYYQQALQNATSNDQWQSEYDENKREYDQNYAYQQTRDAVSDEQWNKEFEQALAEYNEGIRQYNQNFDYQKERDATSDSQWQTELDYQKERDATSDSQWQAELDYQKERDATSDSQWQTELDYQKERDATSDSQWQTELDYQKERDTASDSQWQQELNESIREYDQNHALDVSQWNYQVEQDQAAQEAAAQLAEQQAAQQTTQQKSTTTATADLKDVTSEAERIAKSATAAGDEWIGFSAVTAYLEKTDVTDDESMKILHDLFGDIDTSKKGRK